MEGKWLGKYNSIAQLQRFVDVYRAWSCSNSLVTYTIYYVALQITGENDKLKVDQKAVDDFVEEVLPSNLKSGRHDLAKEWKLCKAGVA